MADLQPLFLSLSARFAGLSYRQLDRGIEETIAELGILTGVDRVYLIYYHGPAPYQHPRVVRCRGQH